MGNTPIFITFTLINSKSKMDQKIIPNRYQVVPRTLIFILHGDEILLLKGSENKKIWAGDYNGVGGHIERGETVLNAAKRELFEETGINDVDLRLRSIILIDVEEDLGINLFVFVGEVDNKHIISGTEGELTWINRANIEKYMLVEDLYELIPKILESREDILFGNYSYIEGKLSIFFSS